MLALAVLLATAPVLQMSEQQLDRSIADAHLVPAIGERVERLSALFVGVPYGDYPLGEGSGVEPQPRWRVDKVDCQTFVETVLAMANAKSLDRARTILDDIRYAGDPPKVSFATRNHFTEAQWLPANTEKGYLREETRTVEPRAESTTLSLRRKQWEKVPGLRRLSPAKVRHASIGEEHRVIDLELGQFLDRQREYKKWPVQGVALLLPLDAQARVTHLTAR